MRHSFIFIRCIGNLLTYSAEKAFLYYRLVQHLKYWMKDEKKKKKIVTSKKKLSHKYMVEERVRITASLGT